MADYRFARTPRWIATHILAAVLVVLFLVAGFWQLRRLDERRARNDLILGRQEQPAVAIGEVLPSGAAAGDDEIEAARFRPVLAAGSYLTGPDATIRSPGGYVLSALELGGEVVAVLRGSAADLVPPPEGEIEVEGFVVPRDRMDRATRTAVDRLATGGRPVLPVVVQAVTADAPGVTPVPPPELDEGPHLGYALQWFLFATVGIVGYPFFLRRRARERH